MTIEDGQALMRALRGRLSGLCQPTYVLDIPGGHGKVPIGPAYLAAATPGLKELVTIGKIWELAQLDRKVKSGRKYDTVIVDAPAIAPIYEAKLVLVRPDTHVAWRGNECRDGRAVWSRVLQ